jgi:release factor glutamine methyltransferase
MAAAALRARGAPLAYAVGRAHFRHLTLDVDPRVLIPRPETEQLVDLVLAESAAHALPGEALVVDVGTGSGAIALAVATEGPFARVIGTDISLDALEVARRNASRLAGHGGARVELLHGSLLQPVRAAGERAHVVVSNPPYIADGEAPSLPRSVRDWEPAVALYSGHDGLSATRRLVAEAVEVLMPGGLLAMEVDARRASLAAELVASESRFHAVRVILDFSGRERFVLARLREGGGE